MSEYEIQEPKPSGSEGEDFLTYFPCLYGSNQSPLAQGHFGSWDLYLNKLGKEPLCHAASQVILEKMIFEYFSMYFYGSNPGRPGFIFQPGNF